MSEKSGLKLLYKFPDDFIIEKMQREEDGRLHIAGAFAGEVFARRVAEAKVEPQTTSTQEGASAPVPPYRGASRAAIEKYFASLPPPFLAYYRTPQKTESTSQCPQSNPGKEDLVRAAMKLSEPEQQTAHSLAPAFEESSVKAQLEAAQALVQALQYVLNRP